MNDHDSASRPWRRGLLHDLEVALCRLDAVRPTAEADIEAVARWALVTADVRSTIAELTESCAEQPGDAAQVPIRASRVDGL